MGIAFQSLRVMPDQSCHRNREFSTMSAALPACKASCSHSRPLGLFDHDEGHEHGVFATVGKGHSDRKAFELFE